MQHAHDENCNHDHMDPQSFTRHMNVHRTHALRELEADGITYTHGCMVDFAAYMMATTALSIALASVPGDVTMATLLTKNEVFSRITEQALDKLEHMLQARIQRQYRRGEEPEEPEFE